MPRLLCLLALFACPADDGSTTDTEGPSFEAPPEACAEAVDLTAVSPWFVEKTDAAGLTDVRGNRFNAVDFSGDGLPDLVVNSGTNHTREDFDDGDGRLHYLLENQGDGTFSDVTRVSGFTATRDGGEGRSYQLTVWADVDGDGDLDAFAGSFYDRNNEDTWTGDTHEVLLNNGDGTFALAPDSDVQRSESIAGASFVDVDLDGNVDLWTTAWYEQYGASYASDPDRLYLGNGDGTFTEVTEGFGLAMKSYNNNRLLAGETDRPAYGATACDVDGDGDGDLLSTIYGRQWNFLWRNDGGSFTDVSTESGYAGDDNLDYSDNMFYRCWCDYNTCSPDPGASSLGDCATYQAYWNDGIDDQPFRLNGNSFATVCGDVDNDGDLDLYNAEIVHWHIGESSDASELLVNDGTGVFTRPGTAATGTDRTRTGAWNEGDLMVSLLDVDHDGWKDVLLNASDYEDNHLMLWRQKDPLSFRDKTESAGLEHYYASGIAIADFDADGDLDVVVGTSTARGLASENSVHLYDNQLGGGNFARFALVGGGTNTAAIGARVVVEAGGIEQTFEVGGGYGHFGIQHDLTVDVGLDDACTMEKVTVHWPGGDVLTLTDVPANYRYSLAESGEVSWTSLD